MESAPDNKNYELAYHLNIDLEESALAAQVEELAAILTQNSGTLLSSPAPKRQHLSYPIQHKHYSHFGTLVFSIPSEHLEKINNQLKLQNHLMRYLITIKEKDDKPLRAMGNERSRPKLKTHKPTNQIALPEVKPEQIEKEIEEVLGKI